MATTPTTAPVEPTAVTDAYQCPDCDTLYRQDDLVTVYECGRCGATSDERRCSDCNIFARKATGQGCADDFAECEPATDVVEDNDGELIFRADYDPTASRTERETVAAAAARAEQKAKAAAELAAARAKGVATTWGGIEAGVDVLAAAEDAYPVVRWVGRHRDGRVAVVIEEYGAFLTELHDPTEPVTTRPHTPSPLDEPMGWNVADADRRLGSGPVENVTCELAATSRRDNARLPLLVLRSPEGWGPLVAVADQDEAQRVADALDEAAHRLADRQGITLNDKPALLPVEHVANTTAQLPYHNTVLIGDHATLGKPVAQMASTGHMLCAFPDPNMLASMAATIRANLDHLVVA